MEHTVMLLALFFTALCLASNEFPQNQHIGQLKSIKAKKGGRINADLVDKIHNKTSLFKARQYKKFEGMNRDQLRRFLGTGADPQALRHRFKRAATTASTAKVATPPVRFNVSNNWPKCKAVFEKIENQGDCAASWAVATTSSIADRLCVKLGVPKPRMSAWDLLSCCDICLPFGGDGCDGYSHPVYGVMWFVEQGIVTGGPYNGAGCKPFAVSPDASDPITNTTCSKTCQASYTRNAYNKDLIKGRAAVVRSNTTLIKNDIVVNGPSIATFEVYDDFYAYDSGIYQHVEGDFIGVQSVRIVGWGVTAAGVKFWKVANSWGTDWGEAGFFRILREVNECTIESYVVSALV